MTTPTKPRPLVLGEIAKVEELAGVPADQWDEAPSHGKFMAALVLVYKRRTDKTFTWNDAMGLDLEEAQAFLKENGYGDDDDEKSEEPDDELDDGEEPDDELDDGEERPTQPAKAPARSRRASKTSASSSESSD